MRTLVRARGVVLLGCALFILTTASTADAQYFGRNKVQYKDFAFETLETEHFHVFFYPEEA